MQMLLRAVTAASAVVTAVCAVVVAVVVVSGNATVRVDNLRTFDRMELSSAVYDLARDRYPGWGVSGWSGGPNNAPCPGYVAIREGTTFTCTFEDEGKQWTVPGHVKDSYGGGLEVGEPTLVTS
ncbi:MULTISPECIES: DUF4333 domain-containing protein [Saccharothrix]|uniref:DUF4333 domain-containing protein n=1 Tax=Saccharothrix TaxID=2071 RepID=UPI00093EBE86|nr:DUF4333 domain-containing protein [Saccharothrix sp. CB00851]OKI20853.1 hypothetical protein A6A25_37525 [Saccharothrix sp. CB00851]